MRDAARTVSREFKNSENTIWFQGHWGFQYYMEKEGGIAMDFENFNPRVGDMMIMPNNNTNTGVLYKEANSRGVLRFRTCPWLSTMNHLAGAGFYTHMWGPLPFASGPVRVEKYGIYVFRRQVNRHR